MGVMSEANASDLTYRDRRKLVAVMYADMVGYSRLIGLDDAGTLARFRSIRQQVIDPAIEEYGGKVVQTGGDSLLVVFDSIDGAVRCAVQVQKQVPLHDGDHPPDRAIRFRLGINIGDAIADGTDLHGDAVNVAARLQAECPPGSIFVSRSVRDHVHGRLSLEFDELGPLNLKNIARPIEAFALRVVTMMPIAETTTASIPSLSIRAAPTLSLAVLPFAYLGSDTQNDYLADAITEDLTTQMAQWPEILVIARASSSAYRGKSVDLRQVGDELGVRYVIDGSLRKFGERLRVTVQLISTETNAHLWTGSFDQDVANIGGGYEDIVSRLRAGLRIRVLDAEVARSRVERRNVPNVFDLLLRARSNYYKPWSRDRSIETATLFEEALRLDPTSVSAMCGIADPLLDRFLILGSADRGNEDLLDRAAIMITRAADLEPNNERVIFSQGYLLRAIGCHREAAQAFEHIIEYSPTFYAAYRHLGFCNASSGEWNEAIAHLQRSIRHDPFNAYNRTAYAWIATALLMLRRDHESIEFQQRALRLGRTSSSEWRAQRYLMIACAYALAGLAREAQGAQLRAAELWPYATARNPMLFNTARGMLNSVFRAQEPTIREALGRAGLRDHADEDADYCVQPSATLHADLVAPTPMTVPGATTIRTGELSSLLLRTKPLLIDVALDSWGYSLPGAVGLQGIGHGAAFSEGLQARFARKIHDLTGGDLTRPIVVFCVNCERFTGYNAALRLAALGYTRVHWYRGGVEAWEVNGQREDELVLQAW
jgi:PQQ-dependent catabolism-associated CXXCW motif protein